MNIAQELSIVRDNIAEYGMTNITQLEYDAIYQQGRADKYQEITSEYMLLTEKQVEEIRADAIEEVKSKMISFHTDAIFQYGADIIDAKSDAFDELKDWLEVQQNDK